MMNFRPTQITVFNMKINACDNLSTVSFSNSKKIGAVSRTKKNQAFGQQLADRAFIVIPKHETNDNDFFDSNTGKIK